jgi:hypothetical protein
MGKEELDKVIDWDDFLDLCCGCSTYCCKPSPSSIKEFRTLVQNKDSRVWQSSGIEGVDSDSGF